MKLPKKYPIKYKITDNEGTEWGRFRNQNSASIEKKKLQKDFPFLEFQIVTIE